MIFYDIYHEKFFKEKYKEFKKCKKTDVYYISLLYTLGISHITRDNFEKIFDVKNGEIIPSALMCPWQTSSSLIVTRLAFNLYNDYIFDSEDDCLNSKISSLYSVSELFCSTYAHLFFEAIKIRYSKLWEVK